MCFEQEIPKDAQTPWNQAKVQSIATMNCKGELSAWRSVSATKSIASMYL